MAAACSHLDTIRVTEPATHVCEECLRTGLAWVHLRLCLACGTVACCDNSPGRHATAHFHSSGHPLIRSIEPDEDWAWCYLDERFLRLAGR
jgi:uncharacterized UBP type Zn finger protein